MHFDITVTVTCQCLFYILIMDWVGHVLCLFGLVRPFSEGVIKGVPCASDHDANVVIGESITLRLCWHIGHRVYCHDKWQPQPI